MTAGKRIVVLGSLNMDLTLTMERLPVPGETVLGSGLGQSPGGKGANQAFAAAMLGGRVAMLGAVGQDDFGRALAGSLASAGADVSRLKHAAAPTGTAVICVDSAGRNSIVVIAAANRECDAAYLEENRALVEGCDYLLMQLEIPVETALAAAAMARAAGKTVVLNPAPAPHGLPDSLLSGLDYITPNETELAALTGLACDTPAQIEEAARALLARGVKAVVVTMGAAGALLATAGGSAMYPTAKVRAVDTTAAGDCFNAGLVVALAEGKVPADAVRFANAAAGISVTRPGAQISVPTRAEVDAALAR